MELSQKIYELRTGSGLSQLNLAEKLGVSRQSVSKWETGQAVPDLDKLIPAGRSVRDQRGRAGTGGGTPRSPGATGGLCGGTERVLPCPEGGSCPGGRGPAGPGAGRYGARIPDWGGAHAAGPASAAL